MKISTCIAVEEVDPHEHFFASMGLSSSLRGMGSPLTVYFLMQEELKIYPAILLVHITSLGKTD